MRNLGYLWQTYQLQSLSDRSWSYRIQVWVNGVLYTSNEVYANFKKDLKIFSDGFTLGCCPSEYFEVSVIDKVYIPPNVEVRFEVMITGPLGDTDWMPFGTYFIDSRSTGVNTVTLHCYDRMLLGDQLFWVAAATYLADPSAPSLKPPQSMSTAISIACMAMNTTLDARSIISNDLTIKPDADMTCREVLGYIASANGGNFIITDEDKLRLVVLANGQSVDINTQNDFLIMTASDLPQVIAVSPSNFFTDELSRVEIVRLQEGILPTEYPVDAQAFEYGDSVQLQCLVMMFNDASTGSDQNTDPDAPLNYYLSGTENGTPVLELTNPYATQVVCNSVYELIRGYEYRGFTGKGVTIDPAAEFGDPIILRSTFISIINISFHGIMVSDLESPISGNSTSEFPFKSVAAKTFSRVMNKIKGVVVSLEVTNTTVTGLVTSVSDQGNDVDSLILAADALTLGITKTINITFPMIVMPTDLNTTDAQKGMICTFGADKYYWNTVSLEWLIYTGTIESFAEFTASGFTFNGNVKISGALINEGILSTDLVSIESDDGKLSIAGTAFKMTADDGTVLTIRTTDGAGAELPYKKGFMIVEEFCESIAAGNTHSQGSFYVSGEYLRVLGGSGDALIHIDSVSGGLVLTWSWLTRGTHYTTGNNITTEKVYSSNPGSGFTIDITAINNPVPYSYMLYSNTGQKRYYKNQIVPSTFQIEMPKGLGGSSTPVERKNASLLELRGVIWQAIADLYNASSATQQRKILKVMCPPGYTLWNNGNANPEMTRIDVLGTAVSYDGRTLADDYKVYFDGAALYVTGTVQCTVFATTDIE